jgi:hypothetical protein
MRRLTIVLAFVVVVAGAVTTVWLYWVERSLAALASARAREVVPESGTHRHERLGWQLSLVRGPPEGTVVSPLELARYVHNDVAEACSEYGAVWGDRLYYAIRLAEELAARLPSERVSPSDLEAIDRALAEAERELVPVTELVRAERRACLDEDLMEVNYEISARPVQKSELSGESGLLRRLPDRWRIALLWRRDYAALCELEGRVAAALAAPDPVAVARAWPDARETSLLRINGNGRVATVEEYIEDEVRTRAALRAVRTAIAAARAR